MNTKRRAAVKRINAGSLFHKHVLQAFSNRDMRGLDEKTIKMLVKAPSKRTKKAGRAGR